MLTSLRGPRSLVFALFLGALAGCPNGGDDDDSIPDDDDATADDDDATADDDDSSPDDDDSSPDDDDSAGDDDDATGDDDDSAGDDDDSAGDDDDSAGDDDDDSAPVDGDGDGVTADLDCDDTDGANFPGNSEVCDGADNDCDPSTALPEIVGEIALTTTTDGLVDRFLGNVFQVEGATVLRSFAQRLQGQGAEPLLFVVYESTALTTGFSVLATSSSLIDVADAGVMSWHSSPAFDLPLLAGRTYVLGVHIAGVALAEVVAGPGARTPLPFGSRLPAMTAVGDTTGAAPDGALLADSFVGAAVQRLVLDTDTDSDSDGSAHCDGDCNDGLPNAMPGGLETTCDLIDNDCDLATADCMGGLVVTEVFNDAFGSDADQEWFEIWNASTESIDLSGFLLHDDGDEDLLIETGPVLGPGDFAVIGAEDDLLLNGGVLLDLETGSQINLSNGEDEIRLVAPSGELIDGIAWNETDYVTQEGASMNLDAIAVDAVSNDDAANWCLTFGAVFSGSSTGTPGASNVSCVIAPSGALFGDLVIHEILYDPAGTDGDREWFELRNDSASDIDLLGFAFSDLAADFFVVTQSLVVGASDVILLGNSADLATNGGLIIPYAYGGNMTLGNEDDELIVVSPEGLEIDRVEWDGGPNFEDPEGASLSLDPGADATSNDLGVSWCASLVGPFGTNVDLGSPGQPNASCPN